MKVKVSMKVSMKLNEHLMLFLLISLLSFILLFIHIFWFWDISRLHKGNKIPTKLFKVFLKNSDWKLDIFPSHMNASQGSFLSVLSVQVRLHCSSPLHKSCYSTLVWEPRWSQESWNTNRRQTMQCISCIFLEDPKLRQHYIEQSYIH